MYGEEGDQEVEGRFTGVDIAFLSHPSQFYLLAPVLPHNCHQAEEGNPDLVPSRISIPLRRFLLNPC